MTITEDLQNMEGRTAVDKDGAKLGKIGQVYVDDQSGQPLWVTISTGMFGTKESFAPLYGARTSGDNLQLAVTKDMVKDAPGVEADGHIGDSENDALYEYYAGHLGDSGQDTSTGGQYAQGTREDLSGREGVQGRDTSGPTTDDAMTGPRSGCVSALSRSGPAGPGCASTSSPRTSPRPSRSVTRKSASSGSRSPTPAAATRCPARTSVRKSTKSPSTPNGP
jgi:hypothetical protein